MAEVGHIPLTNYKDMGQQVDTFQGGIEILGAAPEVMGGVGGGTTPATIQGIALTATRIVKALTALADATATTIATVTIPNANHGAMIRVTVLGVTGDGDSADSAIYTIGISRAVGVTSRAVVSTKSVVGASGAGATATAVVTVTVTAMVGAVGVTQTFTIQVAVARTAGASTNHVAVAELELLNAFATGITMA